jgi:hypothetical protein
MVGPFDFLLRPNGLRENPEEKRVFPCNRLMRSLLVRSEQRGNLKTLMFADDFRPAEHHG